MTRAGGLSADYARIESAGRELQQLSQALERSVSHASQALGRVEGDIGDRAVAAEVAQLERTLARIGRQSMHAVAGFGRQVDLVRHVLAQADHDLDVAIRRATT